MFASVFGIGPRKWAWVRTTVSRMPGSAEREVHPAHRLRAELLAEPRPAVRGAAVDGEEDARA